MLPLYWLTVQTVGTAIRGGWKPQVSGLEHVPAEGGVVLAGNHQSFADQLFLGAVLPRHVAFWGKTEYFTGTGPRGALNRGLMHGLGVIPVNRDGGAASDAAFESAVPVLEGGGMVAVFPEGTRSPDGRLYRGRTGALRLAQRCGVPVLPVGITGTRDVRPRDLLGRGRPPVAIRFGPPVDVTGADVRTATDALMATIRELSGQEYVPHYAEKKKAA
ncbi:lysophospholipid acyltransferase family protein [Blastococcus goldschmidtiae]|uniref:Lysophospholipid acyltransferase family protein n=1 Tax=Blastococcus goldschmidtiae TaxID=3075546 RepID=A0ABU2KDS8_9ACTN|nr:lysophospholipid acyltransferase family protein [Blastococcus sp. DSM 46792]MDT0278343.1 lysophospholipid acyltransferase family protein [Blastococcus sp. DSM 46792]